MNQTELKYGEVYECVNYSPPKKIIYIGKSTNQRRKLRNTAISRNHKSDDSVFICRFDKYVIEENKLKLGRSHMSSSIKNEAVRRWAKNLLENMGI